MKLGTLVWRGFLILVVLAGLGQYWLVQRTQEEAARFIARLIPHGDLHYERLWPFPWGAGRVWGLSFRPEGGLQMALQTPMGMLIEARELRIRELRLDDAGHLARVRGTLLGVRIPIAERRAPKSESPDPARIPPPTLFDLGYTEFRGDVEFDIQYVASAGLATLSFDIGAPQIGRALLTTQLEGSPEVFDRAPDQIMVRKLALEFSDQGLLTRYKDVSAGRARLSRAAWESAMIAALNARALKEGWKWSDETAAASRKVIRESGYFHAAIDPPGDIALRNIRLYPMADWPPLLGFGLSTTPDDPPLAPPAANP
ncbi:hypothetical protein DFR24_2511 [Panacagrimonas perspica]|uniref:DUF2125 domain-containing protein n=1 Tax=Panacagrimonas perspica TaxID=381431 RepID=A0A4S3JYY2_9GAMM|nr:hypothetical protein [Panacagrimonas perspica]TDU28146.1 hypothetical protein DFR24_2511 [Panacagrimonas perspica]THD00644.1 hypothetical protein B1810_23865 [Panacagrimonas perspica]